MQIDRPSVRCVKEMIRIASIETTQSHWSRIITDPLTECTYCCLPSDDINCRSITNKRAVPKVT